MLHYKCFIKKGHTCLGVAFFITTTSKVSVLFLCVAIRRDYINVCRMVRDFCRYTGSEPAGDRSSVVLFRFVAVI